MVVPRDKGTKKRDTLQNLRESGVSVCLTSCYARARSSFFTTEKPDLGRFSKN